MTSDPSILSIPAALSLGGSAEQASAKIYVLHENKEWFEPLKEAFQKFALPYEEWFLHEGKLDLSGPPPRGVFYNRMSASSHTRGHRFGPEFTSSVLAWLESHDRTILNGWRAVQLEVSKVYQYEALRSVGVRTPKTIAAVGERAILDASLQFEGPFITKHNRGGKGLGVQLFQNQDAFVEHVRNGELESSLDGITLLQEYIKSEDQSIVRVEFVDQKLLYAVRVDTSEGFELCPADNCQIGDAFCPAGNDDTPEKKKFEIIDDFQSEDVVKYQELMKGNNLHIAAFEFITDTSGNRYTYDINTNTNYNSSAESGKIKGMEQIAKTLGEKLASLSPEKQVRCG